MLVLTRSANEKITMVDDATGERIELVVVRVNKHNARLGIESSQRWRIYRNELEGRDKPATRIGAECD